MIRLKELRKYENLTQKELAKKIWFSAHNVGDWERGKAEPSISELIKLSDIFNCSVDYLICRTNDLGVIDYDKNTDNELLKLISIFRRLPTIAKSYVIRNLEEVEKLINKKND